MSIKEKIYNKTNMKIYQILIIIFLLIIIDVSTTRLFINQTDGTFPSDLCAHINDALDEEVADYSITAPIYRFLYNNIDGDMAICVFLSIVNILTIFVTKKILGFFIKDKNQFLLWIYAIALDFVIAIVIPPLNRGNWNVGLFQPTVWHNSTYLCMKLFGLLAIYYFFKIRENYLEKIKISDYLIFTILLIITNAIKPNFILVFAPTVAIVLLIDFIKSIKNKNKKAIINIFILGISILISLSVLVYQNAVMYQDDSQGGSGIEFGFLSVYIHYNRNPICAVLQSFALPLFLFITHFKKFFKDKTYTFAFIMDAISLFMYLFMNETGERKYHGNFSWGSYFAMMVTFIISTVILHNSRNEEMKHKKAYLITGYSLFALHFIFGIIYFIRLQLGANFF